MQYNEIYELIKPIYQWLEEHYPHDKYIKIEHNGFSICEDRIMGVNSEVFNNIKGEIKKELKNIIGGKNESN